MFPAGVIPVVSPTGRGALPQALILATLIFAHLVLQARYPRDGMYLRMLRVVGPASCGRLPL